MEQLKACYERYIAAAEKAEKNKSTWNGAFGLGASTKDHPCHDEMSLLMSLLWYLLVYFLMYLLMYRHFGKPHN